MRLSIRMDDKPSPNRDPCLCNIDIYVDTREELQRLEPLLAALLLVLPEPAKATGE
jgi:hypothetical protein